MGGSVMRRFSVWGPVCALALGCASAPAEPPWLADARAREAAPQKERPIEAKGAFHGQVAAEVLQAPKRDGETWYVSLGIGGEAPIDCFVHDTDLDLASSLVGFSRASFDAIAEHFGEVGLRRVESVDAGAMAGGPFLSVEWLYRVGDGNQARLGEIKHLAVSKAGHTVYCQHNEIGYEKTFRRVVEGLVRGLVFAKSATLKPYYEEVSVMTLHDMRVGVEHVALVLDEDGDTRVDLRSFNLIPVDAETFQASDSYGVEFVRRDGTLINQKYVESANGKLATELDLTPESGGWRVHGTYQEKPLEARIDGAQRLGSWLGEVLSVRREIAKKGVGGEVVMAVWVPDADPTRLLEERISILEHVDGDRFRTALDLSGIEAEILADRSGSAASGSVEMGHIQMRFERVFALGKL
jgi:hypothetical protein